MFEKVVLATDLSPAWNEIVACGGELKGIGCSEVILTYVITVKFLAGLEASLRAEAQPLLAAQKEQLEAQGLKVTVEMPLGLPAYSLHEVASRYGASLIVVGSHGKSRWREAVLGSFSSAVLHHARHPVLLLKVRIQEEKPEGTCRLHCTEMLRHLLFPTDFSETAESALPYVEDLARREDSRVTLFHALEAPGCEAYPPGYRETAEAVARTLLEQWQKRLAAAGVSRVETQLSCGHPVPLILEVTRTLDPSLIILGTQGKGFIQEIFLGSTAHNISRLAPSPVLLIPSVSR